MEYTSQDPYQQNQGTGIALFNDAMGSVFRTHQILLNIHHFKRSLMMVEYAEELERWFTEVCSKMTDGELPKSRQMLRDVIAKAAEYRRIASIKRADTTIVSKYLNAASDAGFELEIYLRQVMDRHGLGMPNKEQEGFFNDE